MEHAQAVVLGNCRITVVEIAARLGINVAYSLCKPILLQPFLHHSHSAQIDYS
jgi:hypothetical protein